MKGANFICTTVNSIYINVRKLIAKFHFFFKNFTIFNESSLKTTDSFQRNSCWISPKISRNFYYFTLQEIKISPILYYTEKSKKRTKILQNFSIILHSSISHSKNLHKTSSTHQNTTKHPSNHPKKRYKPFKRGPAGLSS